VNLLVDDYRGYRPAQVQWPDANGESHDMALAGFINKSDHARNARKVGFDRANEPNRNTLETTFVNAGKQDAVTGPMRLMNGGPVKCAVCGGVMRIERTPIAAGGSNRLHCTCGHCEDIPDMASLSASNKEDPSLPEGMKELP